jgi:hypothetical protein
MVSIETTVKFKTFVNYDEKMMPYQAIRSRIQNAREISVIEYRVVDE